MSAYAWFKFNPQDFLDGVVGLTPEERGCYITVLALMYRRQGPVEDDARWLAGNCGLSVRRWSVVRAALIVKGKLFEVTLNGTPSLMNRRTADELAKSAGKPADNSEIKSAKAADKVAENAPEVNENKGLKAPRAGARSAKDLEEEKEKKEETAKAVLSGRARTPSKADVEAIWQATPRLGRERSSRKELEGALRASVARGNDLQTILAGITAAYASPSFSAEYAKGVHRMIQNDRWQSFTEEIAAASPAMDPAREAEIRRRMIEFAEQRAAPNA